MSDNKWDFNWKIQHNTFDTTTSGMFGKKMSEREKQMYRIKNYKNQTLVKNDGSKIVVLTPAPAIQPSFRPDGVNCIDYEYKLIPENVNLDDAEVKQWLKLFIPNSGKDVFIFKKCDERYTYYEIAFDNKKSSNLQGGEYRKIFMNHLGCPTNTNEECRQNDINLCINNKGGKTRKQRRTKSRKQKKSKSRRQRK